MAADHSVPDWLVSAFSGRYDLVREIGRGGAATVYLARDLKHDRNVAIKMLQEDVGDVSGERFLLEIRVSAGMQHPQILPTYDSGVAAGQLYFVMPHVDGGSLRDRLEAQPRLPIEEALSIARSVAIGLAHAHALGVVHRDVKPENILFYHGSACLADFGIARAIAEMNPLLTAQGTFVGTPAYMSPEQYAGVGFDGRSDVYSLAAVLHEMLAGARLFGKGGMHSVIAERGSASATKSLPSDIPEFVAAVVNRGLAADPDKRYGSAQEFADALEQAQWRLRGSGENRRVSWMHSRTTIGGLGAAGLVAVASLAWTMRSRADASVALQGASRSLTPIEQAREALRSWKAADATRAFTAVLQRDSTSTEAQLGLAVAYAQNGGLAGDDFRRAALRLRQILPRLQGRDSLVGEGLYSLASGNPAQACASYRALIARDSTDALAWFGLGDCQRVDTLVVVDPTSPSGWHFESSYHAAAAAYSRVVALDPRAYRVVVFNYLSHLRPSNATTVRLGRSAAPGSRRFAAYPALSGDTLAFIPYPLEVFTAVSGVTISASLADALERNRGLMLDFARQRVLADSSSADAWEALGLARENRGELGDDDAGAGGAVTASGA